VPLNWKVIMVVICLFLVASVAIGVVKVTSTPTEVFGPDFQGLPKTQFPR